MNSIKGILPPQKTRQKTRKTSRINIRNKTRKNVLPVEKEPPVIIGSHYKLEQKIGEGNFGMIYQGTNVKTNEKVAIKFESCDSNIRLLKYETNMIDYLSRHKCAFIPCIYWYGFHTFTTKSFDNSNDVDICRQKKYACFIQPFYEGGSLFENQPFISNIDDVEFRIYCIHYIMKQMIDIIKQVHSFGVVHRDIKPHNFMFLQEWIKSVISNSMTINEETVILPEVRLIDFGFAIFENKEKENHVEETQINHSIIGTPNYTSYFIHRGHDFQCRDDLISIGYIYLFLLWDTLPWIAKKGEPLFSLEQIEHWKKWSVFSLLIQSTVLHGGKFHINKSFDLSGVDEINLKENKYIRSIFLYMNYCYHLSKRDKIFYDELISLFLPTLQEGLLI